MPTISRRTTLLIAIVLALGTGLLMLNYLSSVRSSAPPAQSIRSFLVADADIPARATITEKMLRRVARPVEQIDPDAVSDPHAAVGSIALITIPAGSTITASRIGRPANAALPVRLKPGMRAVTIAVDHVKDVAGLLIPGDRVDVIAIPPRVGDETPKATTILRAILVLAIGDALETVSATPPPQGQSSPTTVTLAVTPKQADLLAMADVNTILRLALRSPQEPTRSLPVEALEFGQRQVASGPAATSQPAADPPQPRRADADGPRHGRVTVIDGDKVLTTSKADAGSGAL